MVCIKGPGVQDTFLGRNNVVSVGIRPVVTARKGILILRTKRFWMKNLMKILCPKCNSVVDTEADPEYAGDEPDFAFCPKCENIISLKYDKHLPADSRLSSADKPPERGPIESPPTTKESLVSPTGLKGRNLEETSYKGGVRMLVLTTPNIEGKKIVRYLGFVSGEAILGTNIFRDIFANIKDIVGGRSGAYEMKLREARDIAIEEMTNEAEMLGANAILGVDMDYETVGQSMLMVTANGTAVVYED